MRELRMSATQRRRLRSECKASSDARIVRRAIALLELDRGGAVAEVAEQVGVTRQTVYNWVDAFMAEGRLRSRPTDDRRGRPLQWNELLERLVLWSLKQRPDDLGYASTLWTVPLLRLHLERCATIRLSDDTLRRRLHSLGYVWKRPRYILEPDPEREKKAPNLPKNSLAQDRHGGAGPRRDRPAAVSTSASWVGSKRNDDARGLERSQRSTRRLRSAEPTNRPSHPARELPAAGG
jgi:transposase